MNISSEQHNILARWMSRLHLLDWKVELLVLDSIHYNGHLDVDPHRKCALISIRDRAPFESTLLHELLELALHDVGYQYELLLEKAITCRVGCSVLKEAMGVSRNRFINTMVELLLEEDRA
jgi:hypothetical protein